MNKNYAPQPAKKNFLILSLFLVLCLPMIVWQIVNENFDIRNLAFEQIEVSEENPCVISFPNVNPYTIEVDTTVRMQVEGIAQGNGITSILITDSTGEEIFSKTYDEEENEIAETFEFTPTTSRAYEMIGTLSEGDYSSACVISSPYDVKGIRVVANNSAPEFTSSPIDSIPSQDINTDTTYEYTMTATDPEGDMINYVFSFTPNEDWMKYTVINDGSNGNLKIQFKGSTSEPASYLANVFIHDGYSKHLRSQSWIVSVNPAENDVPQVTILSPWEALTIAQGKTLTIKWAASDQNAITHYELYLAKSLQDESKWQSIDKNIAYNIEEYSIDTKNISGGIYKAIIKATDNQDPVLTGQGISQTINIVGEEFDIPDDSVTLPEPQIINVSPTSEDNITNTLVTIRASLLSSQDTTINEDSILIKVDNKDVTSQIKFNKISDSEYTLIFQTENEFSTGLHKVEISFTDSENLEANKNWTFTIEGEETDPDKFYFFGYGITKSIVYVVGGGLLLLFLALAIPLILVRVWKDDESTSEIDDTLTPPTHTNTVESIVNKNQIIDNEHTFSKLQTTIPPEATTTPQRTLQPQPKTGNTEDDLKILYEKIGEEKTPSPDNNTPPEPIL
ncbi:hypothetical protein K8R14_00725 [bacterium]|nr:hypothetical protein [bacterium]